MVLALYAGIQTTCAREHCGVLLLCVALVTSKTNAVKELHLNSTIDAVVGTKVLIHKILCALLTPC
eukprot:m.182942 g.182942  ORF g.182942 m.182942 type:complete len:66 (+) comp18475_c0_seq4:1909-2106(+)